MGARKDGTNPRAQGTNPRNRMLEDGVETETLRLRGGWLENEQGEVVGRLAELRIEVPRGGTFKEGGNSPFELQLPIEDEGNNGNEKPPTGGAGGAQEEPDDVAQVWGTYVEAMKPRNEDLDPAGAKIIRDALKVADTQELCRAVRACSQSPFHMGQNDRRRKYNKLSQILKGRQGRETTRERIDFFLDLAENLGVESHFTSAARDSIHRAKREVLDAHEFPHDETVAQRGTEAEVWLRDHGITVERASDGRPTFRESA